MASNNQALTVAAFAMQFLTADVKLQLLGGNVSRPSRSAANASFFELLESARVRDGTIQSTLHPVSKTTPIGAGEKPSTVAPPKLVKSGVPLVQMIKVEKPDSVEATPAPSTSGSRPIITTESDDSCSTLHVDEEKPVKLASRPVHHEDSNDGESDEPPPRKKYKVNYKDKDYYLDESDGLFKCRKCAYESKSKTSAAVRMHVLRHITNKTCRYCNHMQYNSKKRLEAHEAKCKLKQRMLKDQESPEQP